MDPVNDPLSFNSLFGSSSSTASSTASSFGAAGNNVGIMSGGTGMSGFGGAVSSIFSFMGDQAQAQQDALSAQMYGTAAAFAGANAQMSEYQTGTNVMMQHRQTYSVVGGQVASAAAAGFVASGGSAGEVQASTERMGGIKTYETALQGNVNTAGYLQQKQADLYEQQIAQAAEQSAKTAGIGALFGGAISLLAGIL